MTHLFSPQRTPFFKNKIAIIALLFYILLWIYCYIMNTDEVNFWIENILVFMFFPWFFWIQRRFTFSDWSIILIFAFLALHTYGSKNAYTYNTFGLWLKETYSLVRNPYDRIVHSGFGLLMCYPIADYLYNKYKAPKRWVFFITNSMILCLATIFELIEWQVAEFTDSETGETYVATQGDVWDAHKDIALAWIGSIIICYLVKVYHKNFLRDPDF